MFFGYPPDAIANNWFHDCVMEIFATHHTAAKARSGKPIWPDTFPIAHREDLKLKRGFKKHFGKYYDILIANTVAQIDEMEIVCESQQDIQAILECTQDCNDISGLPKPIRDQLKKIMGYCFGLMPDLNMRDELYTKIYDKISDKVCPFCGDERFDKPVNSSFLKTCREDLDHYLPISKYPFAGVNLANLVPMGHKCNSDYKKTKDLSIDAAGNSTPAYNPYTEQTVKLSLLNSIMNWEGHQLKPGYVVDFTPSDQRTDKWDAVFCIKDRLKDNILSVETDDLLSAIGGYIDLLRYHSPDEDYDPAQILELIADGLSSNKFTDMSYLKKAFYEMLHHHLVIENNPDLDLLMNEYCD